MRKSLFMIWLAAALAGCSKSGDTAFQEPAREAAADQAAGPDVGVTAAPGVAFNYRYAFRLANTRIAEVQERHAQMCERLGVNRCRITGMRYRLVNDRDIDAMLAFKLDPRIARAFGKDATAAVQKADGMVVDSEISGVDAGAAIAETDRRSSQLNDELAKLDAQAKQPGLGSAARAQIVSQMAETRRQMRANDDARNQSQESLATTPMVFDYGSGSTIPGFDGSSPLRDALDAAIRSFVAMLSFVLIALGAVLPWALLVAALLLFLRSRPGRSLRAFLSPPRRESDDA